MQGFLDGIVDLGLVRRIEKRDLPRNFGFSVETYEGKIVVFSAITDGIRNSWINCLKKAAGLENQVKKFFWRLLFFPLNIVITMTMDGSA